MFGRSGIIRSFIYLILILSVFLVGCSPAVVLESAEAPAETAEPVPSDTPVPPSPFPSNTRTPPPTDLPIGPTTLSEYPILDPVNLEGLVFLGERSINPEIGQLIFHAFDWSDGGRLFVACTYSEENSSYQVFDLIDNTLLAEIQLDPSFCRATSTRDEWLQFSRDGALFLGLREIEAGSYDYRPAVYDTVNGDLLSTLAEHPSDPRLLSVATFSSEGTRIALTSTIMSPAPIEDPNAEVQAGFPTIDAMLIELYDVQTGGHWGTFLKINDGISDLEYSTEGEYLLAGTSESVFAWHVAGENTLEVDCHFGGITFSPVAEVAALTCFQGVEDPFSLIWELSNDEVIQVEEARGNYYQQLKFSQDGGLLIGLSAGSDVSVWHGVSGEHLYTLPETYPTAVDVHFIADGRIVAILLDDGSLKLYGVK